MKSGGKVLHDNFRVTQKTKAQKKMALARSQQRRWKGNEKEKKHQHDKV